MFLHGLPTVSLWFIYAFLSNMIEAAPQDTPMLLDLRGPAANLEDYTLIKHPIPYSFF